MSYSTPFCSTPILFDTYISWKKWTNFFKLCVLIVWLSGIFWIHEKLSVSSWVTSPGGHLGKTGTGVSASHKGPFFKLSKVFQRGTKTIKISNWVSDRVPNLRKSKIKSLKGWNLDKNLKFWLKVWENSLSKGRKSSKNGNNFRNSV